MACISKRRGRWVLNFYGQNGKRQRLALPDGTTKGQAKEELRAIEEMVVKRVFLPVKKTPLFSEVARDWIEHKRTKLRETTWEVYEGHVRNHFVDLDYLKINRITIATVEKFIKDRQVQEMTIGTLRKILVTLGQILSYAVRHNYLDYNPLREAERPRGQAQLKDDEEACQDMKILNPAQITAFLGKVDDPKYSTLFMLAVFSGARQGELLGLRWGDVDWEGCQVTIQRTFNNGRLFTPKTQTPRGKLTLAPRS